MKVLVRKRPGQISPDTVPAAASLTPDGSHDGVAYLQVLTSPSQEMMKLPGANGQEAGTVLPPPTKPIHVKSRSSIIIHSATNPDRFQTVQLPEESSSLFPAWDRAVVPTEVQAYLDEQSRLADVRLNVAGPVITTITYRPETVLVSPVGSPPVSAPASPHPAANQTDKLQAAYLAGQQAAKDAAVKAGLLPQKSVSSPVLPSASGLVQLAAVAATSPQPLSTPSAGKSLVEPVKSPPNITKANADWMHALERTRQPALQAAGGNPHPVATTPKPSKPRLLPDVQKASANWKNAMQLLEQGMSQSDGNRVDSAPDRQNQLKPEGAMAAAAAAQEETPQQNVLVEERRATDLWEAARRKTAPAVIEKPPVSATESTDVEQTIKEELRKAIEQRAAHRSPRHKATVLQVALPAAGSIQTSVGSAQHTQGQRVSIVQPGVQAVLPGPKTALPGPSASPVLPASTTVLSAPRTVLPGPSAKLPGPSAVPGTVLPGLTAGQPVPIPGLPDSSAGPPGPERLSQAAAAWEHAKNLTKLNANLANLANAAIMQSSQTTGASVQHPVTPDPVEPSPSHNVGLSHLAQAASLEAASLTPMSPPVSTTPASPSTASAAKFPAIVQAMLGTAGLGASHMTSATEQPSAPKSRNRRSRSTVQGDWHSSRMKSRRRNTSASASVAELLAINAPAGDQTDGHAHRPLEHPVVDPRASQLAQFAAIANAHATADVGVKLAASTSCEAQQQPHVSTGTVTVVAPTASTSQTLTFAIPASGVVQSPAAKHPVSTAVAVAEYASDNNVVPPVAAHLTVSTVGPGSAPTTKADPQEAADRITRSMANMMAWSAATKSPEARAKFLAYMNAQLGAKADATVSSDQQQQPAATEQSQTTVHTALLNSVSSPLTVQPQQESPPANSQDYIIVTSVTSESHQMQKTFHPAGKQVSAQVVQNATAAEQPGTGACLGTYRPKVNTATISNGQIVVVTNTTVASSQSHARPVLNTDTTTIMGDQSAASNAHSALGASQQADVHIATNASAQARKANPSTPSWSQTGESGTLSVSEHTEKGTLITPSVAKDKVANRSGSNNQAGSSDASSNSWNGSCTAQWC